MFFGNSDPTFYAIYIASTARKGEDPMHAFKNLKAELGHYLAALGRAFLSFLAGRIFRDHMKARRAGHFSASRRAFPFYTANTPRKDVSPWMQRGHISAGAYFRTKNHRPQRAFFYPADFELLAAYPVDRANPPAAQRLRLLQERLQSGTVRVKQQSGWHPPCAGGALGKAPGCGETKTVLAEKT
ncbi:hypothetical protein JW933_10900 [candidate division FCPU426 bacterium]|nr:hypothetical protein [candidate division FCPU426 bacterium]